MASKSSVTHGDTWNMAHEFHLVADIRIASADTRFGQDENTHGRIPGGGSERQLFQTLTADLTDMQRLELDPSQPQMSDPKVLSVRFMTFGVVTPI
jgi:hypothetical protein